MKKANESHPVHIVLRDWSKIRKANQVVAEKTKRKEIKKNDRSQTS